ncbi:MAG: hypothetical protein AAF850_04075 [Pseudomonadota bacterium]
MTTITIRATDTPAERKGFIRAAARVYENDPHYVAPLEFEVSQRINPETNALLKDAPHRLWIAEKDGAPVGRISAIKNPLHNDRHGENAVHFGFLDAIDDSDVFDALFDTAEDWARTEKADRVSGPFSFSVNEECGLLVDGFDTPPYVMMPHGRPWYQKHLERRGYAKAHDMHALHWHNRKDFIPERRRRFVEKVLDDPRVEIRNLNFKTFKSDIRTLVDIYNNAWSDNWGFSPFTDAQAATMASELRPIITRGNVVLCYVNGEPAAFGLVLPNVNEAIKDFGGKLAPLNWAKLIWRLKIKGLKTARMPLMGVIKKFQGKPLGAAFAYKIIDLVNSYNIDHGLEASELSWILESNDSMLNMLTDMGCKIYKTYRIYEKPLA